MMMKQSAYQFCVLMFLSVVNINALSLIYCSNQLENEVCELTCFTTDHSKNVAFSKLPDAGNVIAQCVPGVKCFGTSQYNITQPSPVSTVLSFVNSRQDEAIWRCDYGLDFVVVNVSWATYPQNVSTTMTSNTVVNADIHVHATLECLYSAQSPRVTLQYVNSIGDFDAKSETFKCEDTPVACADGNFTTYACPVIITAESGINHSDIYSIQLKTKVSNVQTEDVKIIATGITFKRPTTTAEQQTTTDETTTTDTTTTETNDGSNDNPIAIIIGPILGTCVLIGIIIMIIMVLVKIRGNKRDYVNTTKQANSIKTLEPIVNKSDTPENMVMQHSNHRIMQ